jgi:hypothetical protein
MCGSRKRSPGTDCPSASLGSMADPATVERRDGRIGTALLERCLHRINIPDGPPGDPFGNERDMLHTKCELEAVSRTLHKAPYAYQSKVHED